MTAVHPSDDTDTSGGADPRWAAAIELFNAREFYACHDVLEEIWSETLEGREFYQGLIHAAVALFHFGEGNLGGARKMAASSLRYLGPYEPTWCGIDVTTLVTDLRHCFADLMQPHTEYPRDLVLNPDLIPRIGPAGGTV